MTQKTSEENKIKKLKNEIAYLKLDNASLSKRLENSEKILRSMPLEKRLSYNPVDVRHIDLLYGGNNCLNDAFQHIEMGFIDSGREHLDRFQIELDKYKSTLE